MEPPVRICCGQQHTGNVCPDGLVMCQLCFDRFPIEALHITEDGRPEDVCRRCAEEEATLNNRLQVYAANMTKLTDDECEQIAEKVIQHFKEGEHGVDGTPERRDSKS